MMNNVRLESSESAALALAYHPKQNKKAVLSQRNRAMPQRTTLNRKINELELRMKNDDRKKWEKVSIRRWRQSEGGSWGWAVRRFLRESVTSKRQQNRELD